MKEHSYCKLHDTYPGDNEPCWACVYFFNETLELDRFTEPGQLLNAASKLAERALECIEKLNNSTQVNNGTNSKTNSPTIET